MLGAVEEMLSSAPASVVRARSILVKALYLRGVKRLLEDDPSAILAQLEEMRGSLFRFSNIRVLVIANIEKLPKPVSTWEILQSRLDGSKVLNPLESRLARLSEAGKNPGNLSYIVPMPTIDSSFALSVSKGPSSLQDPRLPALIVALSYLDAVEGPMWTAVRGTGLAYGTSFSRHTESGQISFNVYRSPNAFRAFETSKTVVEGFVSGSTEFEPLALEGAISSIVLSFANSQSTMSMTAQMSFVRQVIRGLPPGWNDMMLAKVREVEVAEIRQVMKEIVMPIFDAKTANLIVTCAPIMEQPLLEALKGLGFSPEVRALASFQDGYGMKGRDGEAEEDLTYDEEEEGDLREGDGESSELDEDEEGEEEEEKLNSEGE